MPLKALAPLHICVRRSARQWLRQDGDCNHVNRGMSPIMIVLITLKSATRRHVRRWILIFYKMFMKV